jgi:hypothetical protein
MVCRPTYPSRMSIVPFDALPDSARLWVFASDEPLIGAVAETVLASVDRFLSEWHAHGVPLRSARDWREDRFLAVGVDVNAENASGCSIDGLFRTLQQLERTVGTRLVGGGRLFYRTDSTVETASREEFAERAKRGHVTGQTPVFDTSVVTAGDWRTRFERPAGETWVSGILG